MWNNGNSRILLAVVFFCAWDAAAAAGATIHVDRDAPGVNNGTNWKDAYRYLQDALKMARSGDTIVVAEGMYTPDKGGDKSTDPRAATFRLKSGVVLKGGYAGFGQTDPYARDIGRKTILSGDLGSNDKPVSDISLLAREASREDNSYHVVTASGTDTGAVLDGFVIAGGNANKSVGDQDRGGGCYCYSGRLSIAHCDFQANSATVYGGAMYINGGEPKLNTCVFTGNRADQGGGAMYNTRSSPTITDCNFTGNSATAGGGMRNADGSVSKLSRCTFRDNYAGEVGGGMHNSQKSNPVVSACNIIDNRAAVGAGICSDSGSNPTIRDGCTFARNHAIKGGGGMYNNENSPTITDSSFVDNDALWGGGMYNDRSNPKVNGCRFTGNSAAEAAGMQNYDGSNPTISRCTFQDNDANSYGGGMYNQKNCSPTITDCRFIHNSAERGGGMRNWDNSSPIITDCNFIGNDANDRGGGMYNGATSDPSVTNCHFASNFAVYGGGMYNQENSPTITDSNFVDNDARWGGGMYNFSSSPAVTQCHFGDNSATSGGGMRNYEGSHPIVTGCTFQDNDANDYGGGMYNEKNSSPTITNSLFQGNFASHGAGMLNEDQCDSRITRCQFRENEAGISGGAMYNEKSNARIIDCNLVGNSAKAGAGLYNDESSPTITHCTFTRNDANDLGGGMSNGLGSDPNVTDCDFVGNSASAGGGMYNAENSPTITDSNFADNRALLGGGMYNISSSPGVAQCRFSGNSATRGGGMRNYNGSKPTISSCTFQANDANEYGGGVYNEKNSSPVIIGCTFISNHAQFGGGMRNFDNSNATIRHCTFRENDANKYGGGMHNLNSSPILASCVLAGNVADWGGAMDTSGRSNAQDTKVISCLFNGNRALAGGGGLSSDGCDPTLLNCTFVYNSANTGGALCSGGLGSRTVLRNCILWGNSAAYGPQWGTMDTATLSFSYCDVQGGREAAYTKGDSTFVWDASNFDLDPRLTPDGHLTAGSPCLNAGDPGVVFSGADANDIDGEPRVCGPRIDIGCDEFVDTDSDGLPDVWEQTYFGNATAAVDNADPDGDGLTNREEYLLYSSNPVAAPRYVAAAHAGGPTADGTRDHPYGTIQEGLAAADAGDTVLVTPGTYAGPGNTDLDFRGRAVVLRAEAGPSATIITGEGKRGVFRFQSGETPASAVVGFTIQRGVAEHGGAIYCKQSHPQIRDCALNSNRAIYYGGAIFIEKSMPWIADCVVTGSEHEGICIRVGGARLEGKVQLVSDRLETEGAFLWGSGVLEIDETSVLDARDDIRIRCGLAGNGTFNISGNAECLVEGDAVIDLSRTGRENGKIVCNGLLRMKDRTTLKNADVRVRRVRLEGGVIVSNSVITAESGIPFGQFYIEGTAHVEGNEIHADGDRYMDLDPATFRGVVANNRIYVTVTEGQNNTLGGLLELRGLDLFANDYPADQFLRQHAGLPPFNAQTWTIEELNIAPGAKVNLTNRFDFGNGDLAEVMYVKTLKLGNGSVLNTAFNRLYYGVLEQAPTAAIVDRPILGLSLHNITFDNADDYASRIVRNNFVHSSVKEYSRSHVDPAVHPLDPNGMMRMRSLKDLDPSSPTFGQVLPARAKGLFDKSSEREVLVRFEYLFCSAQGELVVYLSDVPELLSHDDPARAAHYLEVGRVKAAALPAGWPGSHDSNCLGAFEKIVPVGQLEFRRGTRVELEFVSPVETCVWINNFDPGIRCPGVKCGDVAGSIPGAVDVIDFLAVLSECGRRIENIRPIQGTTAICLDCYSSQDKVVTIEDALAIAWAMNGGKLPCTLSEDSASPAVTLAGLADSPRLVAMNPSVGGAGSLQIASKGHGVDRPARKEDYLNDYLYSFTASGIRVGAPSPVQSGKFLTRIIRDSEGKICQLDAEQGLWREGRQIVPPKVRTCQGSTVYIGLNADPTGWVWSPPLQDAAFGKGGDVYVVPVVVNRDGGSDPKLYRWAAARLHLESGANAPYQVVQLYDITLQQEYGLHEIEVDADGRVYVLKSCPSNTSEGLFVFDGITGQPMPDSPFLLAGAVSAPTCLHVSNKTGNLYLSSALNEPDAVSSRLYVRDKNAPGVPKDVVEIPGMSHITGITEDDAGAVWAVGFTIQKVPSQNVINSGAVLNDAFYQPFLAKAEYLGGTWAVTPFPQELKWTLPTSVVWVGSGSTSSTATSTLWSP